MLSFFKSTLFLVLVICISVTQVCGKRILCVSQQFKSHQLMIHAVAEGLIAHGHEVYTVFSDKMMVPKRLQEKGLKVLRYHTPAGHEIMAMGNSSKDMVTGILNKGHVMVSLHSFSAIALGECIDMDNDAALHEQLLALEFDLVLVDIFPLSYCMSFIPLKLNIPYVIFTSSLGIEVARSPFLPSFIPSPLTLYSDDMTFAERLVNTYGTVSLNWPWLTGFPALVDLALLEKYNRDPEVKSWNDWARKAQLFFRPRDYALEYPTPLTPNVISIECITCKPRKALSKSMEELIGDAEGIIVVSFGSFVDDLPEEVAAKFVEAFAQRKELILWRFAGKLRGNISSNVKVMDWLPQNDLLAHPRTKLFITHSGNNGQYESVYHGVPMLAFPIFAEQPHNAARIVKHGFGLWVDIHSFTSRELSEKIAAVIGNPSYRAKTWKMSRILKNRPMDASQKAVYWIEHVLEFGGDHLRTHALNMPWYSFYMIDILMCLQAILLVAFCSIACICYIALGWLWSLKSKQKQH